MSPLERMERKKAEIDRWLDLLEKASNVVRFRAPAEDDLAALRVAVNEMKKRKR